MRRNPDLKWRQDMPAIEQLAAKQLEILQSASRLLKPGGRLVYATCSMLQMENQQVAEAFTTANGGFSPVDAGEIMTTLKVERADTLCAGGDSGQRYLQLWPHIHGTDGFFASVWQKK